MHRNDRDKVVFVLVLLLAALGGVACLMFAGCAQLSLIPSQHRPLARSIEVAAASDECLALNRDVAGFTASSIAIGALSGGSGVGSLFTSSTPRYVVGGVGVGLVTLGAVFTYLSTYFAATFTRECSTGVP